MPLAVTAIALFVGLIAAATATIPTASRPLVAVAKQRPDPILIDINYRAWTAPRRRAGSRPTRRWV
jgi:hypothetical protein